MHKVYKFKTDINCGACVRAVKPIFDEAAEIAEWDVDIQNPDKLLTITSDGADLDFLMEIIEDTGFSAEFLEIVEEK
jgi:copper chaperone